jgi:hypothetical protein
LGHSWRADDARRELKASTKLKVVFNDGADQGRAQGVQARDPGSAPEMKMIVANQFVDDCVERTYRCH